MDDNGDSDDDVEDEYDGRKPDNWLNDIDDDDDDDDDVEDDVEDDDGDDGDGAHLTTGHQKNPVKGL